MSQLDVRSKSFARLLALIGFFGLFVLAAMTSLDVLLRWLFQLPIQGVNDISAVVMAVVISACIPANLAMKQNIRVEVFGAVGGARVGRALEAFASLVTFAFIVLVAWQFVPYTAGLRETGDRTWVLAWPVWPWWSAATVLLWLAVAVQAVVVVADLGVALRGDARLPSRGGRSARDRDARP